MSRNPRAWNGPSASAAAASLYGWPEPARPVPAIAQGTGARSWARVRSRVAWSGETRMRPSPWRRERLAERADDVAVDPLEGLDLRVGPPLVARLVGRLDVDADDVVFLQRLDAARPFAA